MYIDGLWLSGMTISIERKDLPIPEAMAKPIAFKLSQKQMEAVAILLGLGLSNGELLSYNDDVLVKLLSDENDDTIKREYRALTSGIKTNRRKTKIFTPVVANTEVNQKAWDNDSALQSSGFFSLTDAMAAAPDED